MPVHSKIDGDAADEWKRICTGADKTKYLTVITSDPARLAMGMANDADNIGLRDHLLLSVSAPFLDEIKTNEWEALLSMRPGEAMSLGSNLVGQIVDALMLPQPAAAAAGAAPAAPSSLKQQQLKEVKAKMYYEKFAAGWCAKGHKAATEAKTEHAITNMQGAVAGTQATLSVRAEGAAADMSVGHRTAAGDVRTR